MNILGDRSRLILLRSLPLLYASEADNDFCEGERATNAANFTDSPAGEEWQESTVLERRSLHVHYLLFFVHELLLNS